MWWDIKTEMEQTELKTLKIEEENSILQMDIRFV